MYNTILETRVFKTFKQVNTFRTNERGHLHIYLTIYFKDIIYNNYKIYLIIFHNKTNKTCSIVLFSIVFLVFCKLRV